jgi:carboxylesterase type B
MDGIECLNLNIAVPRKHGESVGEKLPVMVFIHGGGFIMGSNSWPQYDIEKLVRRSVEMGTGVVGVNIK